MKIRTDQTPSPDSIQQLLNFGDANAYWHEVSSVELAFETFHPQGLVRLNNAWWMSTVDTETSRGFVLQFDDDGRLLRSIDVTDGPRFHPGGIDVDGESIVVPVAEYRPDSTSVVRRIDAATGVVESLFAHDDHLGFVTTSPAGYFAGTWGSRMLVQFDHAGKLVGSTDNDMRDVDFQDAQRLDDTYVLCSGLQEQGGVSEYGGLAIYALDDLNEVRRVRIANLMPSGRSITCNPVWAQAAEGKLSLFVVPDDHQSGLIEFQLIIEP